MNMSEKTSLPKALMKPPRAPSRRVYSQRNSDIKLPLIIGHTKGTVGEIKRTNSKDLRGEVNQPGRASVECPAKNDVIPALAVVSGLIKRLEGEKKGKEYCKNLWRFKTNEKA